IEGMQRTLELCKKDFGGLIFVNLVEFDMLYGHRNDIDGYAAALSEFDSMLSMLLYDMASHDIVIITADHGCDPLHPGTDHSREYTPMLIIGDPVRRGVNLGKRGCFGDIAATVLDYLDVSGDVAGTSFWDSVKAFS
ncbi:MAG TPA: phosphopentomutase, partial [Clostridia bacterium]|nr:phosphopentomutase [Clostridia bacterium]